ncbi:MAG: ATP-binding protein [Bacteriovoracia bacterium]
MVAWLTKRWADLSIAKKLYFAVGIMAALIAAELITLRFSMHTLTAVRAFVGGEGLWSKAQKDALYSLQRYVSTRDEADYQEFHSQLRIPEGDHIARLALEKPTPDLAEARRGFLQGQVHGDDITPMIDLLRRFYWVHYIDHAVKLWGQGDDLLTELRASAVAYHATVSGASPDPAETRRLLDQIQSLNRRLTQVETDFSNTLAAGSRWLERILMTLLFFAVLIVESIGITITYLTSRSLARGLAELNDAAQRIGRGDFGFRVATRSRDELGRMGRAINEMGAQLQASYTELEMRVEERTAELKGMAEENARLYAEAKSALQSRDEFLSIASHELKTPLTALSLQLQMMKNNLNALPTEGTNAARAFAEDPKLQKPLTGALSQVRNLSDLIEELMDLTRLRLGKFNLRPELCDVAKIAREVVEHFREAAAKKGSTLALQAPAPVLGNYDPTRILQILNNLVSNAIKYGRGNPICLRVERAADGTARLSVSDHGVGITPEEQARIFERFERGRSGEGVSGLGLGLYITRQIVEAHGGTIEVQSRPGDGSTFTVSLSA